MEIHIQYTIEIIYITYITIYIYIYIHTINIINIINHIKSNKYDEGGTTKQYHKCICIRT